MWPIIKFFKPRAECGLKNLIMGHIYSHIKIYQFSEPTGAAVRHKANDGVVYAIRVWLKYDTVLSAVMNISKYNKCLSI